MKGADSSIAVELAELKQLRSRFIAAHLQKFGFTPAENSESDTSAPISARPASPSTRPAASVATSGEAAIVATGSYAPRGFDPAFAVPQGAEEADGIEGRVHPEGEPGGDDVPATPVAEPSDGGEHVSLQ